MSSIVPGSTEVPIEIVGGLYTLSSPDTAPPGASPNCIDAEFKPGVPGEARTRSGLLNILQWLGLNQTQAAAATFNGNPGTSFPNNPSINRAFTFKDQQQNRRNLSFDSLQNLWEEFPDNTFNIRGTVYQSKYVKSDTAFGREWLAFSDGKFGTDAPRQWDGVNLDRVTQDGPGTAPLATSVAGQTANLVASPGGVVQNVVGVDSYTTSSITTAGQPSGYAKVTLTTNLSAAVLVGDTFSISGGIFASGSPYPTIAQLVGLNAFLFRTSVTGTDAGADTVLIQCLEQVNLTGGGFVGTLPVAGQYVSLVVTTLTGFNSLSGVWQIRLVISPTQFYVFIPGPRDNAGGAGGGTATLQGGMAAGIHQISVFYLTRNGAFTKPAPSAYWTAYGNDLVAISNIPIGPSNVIARFLCFTAAGQSNFYYIDGNYKDPNNPGTIINDNTTTSATINFTDVSLLSNVETNVDYLFNLIVLGEVAGFMQYFDRMFAWGERNRLPNFLNLGFEGGSIAGGPTGWTSTAAGGSLDTGNSTIPGLAGYRITGDGATAQRGTIYQGAYQSAYRNALQNALVAIAQAAGTFAPTQIPNAPLLFPATAYSVRFRLLKGGAIAQGKFHVNLSSVSGGGIQGTDAAVVFNDANLSGTFFEYILPLCTNTTFAATVPSDLILQVYADGTPTNGGFFVVDDIEIFPTLEPYNMSIVRASLAEDPEAFDGTDGFLNVNTNDDQRMSCLYPIRDKLRMTKEHGVFEVDEDATTEPAEWKVKMVSDVVGSATLFSTGPKLGETGQDWALLLCREGVFIDYGQPYPSKINQEVQISNGLAAFNFDAVNWSFAHTAWITIDMQRRRVLIGLPMGNATTPSTIAALDFRASDVDRVDLLASEPLVHQSTYTNKQVALSGARKWCPWTITANCGGMIERADGTAHLYLGNGAGNGKLYDLRFGQLTDDGVTIPFYYQGSFTPSDEQKQALQFEGSRILCNKVRIYAQGFGNLLLTFFGPGNVKSQTVPLPAGTTQTPNLQGQIITVPTPAGPPMVLQNPAGQDFEYTMDFRGVERISMAVQATGAGSWVSMTRAFMRLLIDPSAAERGQN